MPKTKPPKNYDPFWGDGLPYSQVSLTREVRIIDTEISREFYYITANINPGTHDLLKKNVKKLPQPVVADFLENSKFVDWSEGYQWLLYSREIMGDENPEKLLKEATNKVIVLHKIVSPMMEPLDFPEP